MLSDASDTSHILKQNPFKLNGQDFLKFNIKILKLINFSGKNCGVDVTFYMRICLAKIEFHIYILLDTPPFCVNINFKTELKLYWASAGLF